MQPGSVFAGLILGLFQRFPVYCSLFIVFDIKKDSLLAVLRETNNKQFLKEQEFCYWTGCKTTTNDVQPFSQCTKIRPLCRSAMLLAIASPRP